MNERIKLLAEQARQYAFAKVENSQDPTEWSSKYYNEMFDDKFAELIVQECARAIINDSRLNDVRSASRGCVRTIREHFGVEL
jgi:hypothetical protein